MGSARSLREIQGDLETNTEGQSLMSKDLSSKKVIDALFPDISWDKWIVRITVAQIAIYFITFLGGFYWFQPTDRALLNFGAAYGPGFAKGEIWRVVMPIFLHASLMHLLFNLAFMLHMGLIVESTYGATNFLILYFASGIMGNVLTILLRPCDLAVGASSSGFGLIACILTEIVLVWDKLNDGTKKIYIFNFISFGVLVLIISLVPAVDVYGHLGGFIAGVGLTCYFNREVDSLPSWLVPTMNAAFGICCVALIAMPLRVLLGVPYPMNCAGFF